MCFGLERRDGINKCVLGDQTVAQLSSALLNGTYLQVPLFIPFNTGPYPYDTVNALPLVILSQKTRFTLRTQNAGNITMLQTNPPTFPAPTTRVIYPPGGTGMNLALKLQVAHTTGDEARAVLDMSRDDDGISYMINQNVRQDMDDFANFSNGAKWDIKLSSMTKPLKVLSFGLVPTRLRNNSGFNDKFMFGPQPIPTPPGMNNYQPFQNWQIIANGQTIQRNIPEEYSRLWLHVFRLESPVGEYIYSQYYDWNPCSKNSAGGYLDYTNLNNPVLTINFGNGGTGLDPINIGTAQSLRFVCNALDFNFWFFKSGNWSRAFN